MRQGFDIKKSQEVILISGRWAVLLMGIRVLVHPRTRAPHVSTSLPTPDEGHPRVLPFSHCHRVRSLSLGHHRFLAKARSGRGSDFSPRSHCRFCTLGGGDLHRVFHASRGKLGSNRILPAPRHFSIRPLRIGRVHPHRHAGGRRHCFEHVQSASLFSRERPGPQRENPCHRRRFGRRGGGSPSFHEIRLLKGSDRSPDRRKGFILRFTQSAQAD
jgi:hypothetical protein